jgi:hypothetical protein
MTHPPQNLHNVPTPPCAPWYSHQTVQHITIHSHLKEKCHEIFYSVLFIKQLLLAPDKCPERRRGGSIRRRGGSIRRRGGSIKEERWLNKEERWLNKEERWLN